MSYVTANVILHESHCLIFHLNQSLWRNIIHCLFLVAYYSLMTQFLRLMQQPRLWDYEIQPCIFLPYCWSCWVGVNCVSPMVPTLKSSEWQEYCSVAFISWLLSCFYLFTIHSSHHYWLFWVFQIPVDRYLQRSEWLFVLYRTFYIYIQEEFIAVCLESGSWSPHWSGQSGSYPSSRQVSPLTLNTLK